MQNVMVFPPYDMQFFSADTTIFTKKFPTFFAHENIKKLPSKLAYFTARSEIFSAVNLPKTHILFH